MKYPALITNKAKLTENIHTINKFCNDHLKKYCAVTKCFCANPEIVDVYYKAGVREFADARIPNLKRINYPDVARWLLRLPMLSEIEDVVKYSDISLNSEVKIVAALSEAALKLGKKHKIILMIDVGDLREGVLAENAVETAGEMLKYEGIELYGIGVNFNCFGGIIPNVENVSIVTEKAREIAEKYGIDIPVISGGNSGSMHLLTDQTMPSEVNYLRLGEVVFFGRETSYQQLIENMHEDIFRLEVEIIELQKKPSMPIGEAGLNALGEKVTFIDKGDMLRAIVACGRQDVYMDKITPLDEKIEILGQSSDHMIIDVTHSDKKYEVGDAISFSISYASLLSLSTSEYIYKLYE
ncbi:MAG: alanine/ornithine racemase family PLP-dependent enzyme [Defluviitaleaceae bacterium]|nr:alanine/ornithine racemase family PLP-dependent enzyme [Defluviitaleaceae bacterium]